MRSGPNVEPKYLAIALVVIVALVGGYLAFGRGAGSSAPTVPLAAVTPPAVESPGADPASVAVTASDLGPGWLEKVIPGGDQVAGQVTLDLCGGGYASEGMRIARLQVVFKRGPTVLSNEVVEYAPGGAQLAYQELRRRVSSCPKTPVAMPEQGAPSVLFRLVSLPRHRSWATMSVAVRATETADGRSGTGIGIYQFVGNWMSTVYSQGVSPASRAAVERAAAIAARKLKDLASGGPSA